MADYVKSTMFCQAYIHIESAGVDEHGRQEFESYIQQHVEERSRHFFDENVKVEVKYKDGSDIYYITVFGLSLTPAQAGVASAAAISSAVYTGSALYNAICKYPDFVRGIGLLARQADRLNASTIVESLFKLNSDDIDAIRIESRSGIFMRINQCINKITIIPRLLPTRGIKSIRARFEDAHAYCGDTLQRIDHDGDRELVRENLQVLAEDLLPASLPKDRKQMREQSEVKEYKNLREALIKSLSS